MSSIGTSNFSLINLCQITKIANYIEVLWIPNSALSTGTCTDVGGGG